MDVSDIAKDLEQRHRDAMLDLVLVWGSLDGAFGMLLSSVLGMTLDEGAEHIAKLPTSTKLAKIQKLLKSAPNGRNAAMQVKKHKKNYEIHSRTRNYIAHSHCAGVKNNDKEYIIFMVYKKAGDGKLAVDAVPIQEILRAARWGRAMLNMVLKFVDAVNVDTQEQRHVLST